MIDKYVWSKFGESLRFGKIIDEETWDNWCWVRVDWIDDKAFNKDRKLILSLRGNDEYSDWYRIDKLTFFNKEELLNKINKL
jgi:hypothetical protein